MVSKRVPAHSAVVRGRRNGPQTRVLGKFTNEDWCFDALLKNLLSVCSMQGNMCIYLYASERGLAPASVARFPAPGVCQGDVHFLSQLLPYPGSAGSCLGPVHPRPLPLWDSLLFFIPPSLEILFIICRAVYCLEILVFISLLALTDTQGKGCGRRGGGRKHLVLFYDTPWRLC